MHPTPTLPVFNEIHNLMMIFMDRLTRVRLHEGLLDRTLVLNSGLACHINFQARISALSPTINSLYTEFHFLQILLRLQIPCMNRIFTSAMSQHWKLQLSVLTLSLSWLMTSAMPTHQRAYNGRGPPICEHFSGLKTAYSARNGAPKKAEEPYLRLFVSKKKREMAKPVLTKTFLQPAKAAVM